MNPRLHRALISAGHKDALFNPVSYPFVYQGLQFCSQAFPDSDLCAKVICEGLRLYTFQEFGRLSHHVLTEWGLHSSLDFGKIIFSLIDKKILDADENDKLENFRDIYHFIDTFKLPQTHLNLTIADSKKIDLFPQFP